MSRHENHPPEGGRAPDVPAPARISLSLEGADVLRLFGQNDDNLRLLRERFRASIVARGEEMRLEGPADEVALLGDLFQDLIARVRAGETLTEAEVRYALRLREESRGPELTAVREGAVELQSWKGVVSTRTAGQKEYVQAIREHDLVFSIGPAGTGKTYLAMASAVAALRSRQIERIILVRPAVEAGESLGFLPGDFTEKVGPYLRPLYDALYEMMPSDKIKRSIDMGVIEVAPLAYMRGRTLNSSFVILDEAQNSTLDQMKMFLTRLGFHSKAVVTGDITQIDLADKSSSGLVQIQEILQGVAGLKFIYLSEADVVRHHLVQEIIRAFGQYEERTGQGPGGRARPRNGPEGPGARPGGRR